jgi:peptidyl-dipeptidase A
MAGQSPLGDLLDDLDARLEQLEVAYNEANWRKYWGETTEDELLALEEERARLLRDEQARARIMDAAAHDQEPDLARRLVLTQRLFLRASVESHPDVYRLRNRIDRTIIAFRPAVAGRTISRAEQREILRKAPDRTLRREAWRALAPLAAQIEGEVLSLLRKRNMLARELGYSSYPDLMLQLIGLDRQSVLELFDALTTATEETYRLFLERAAARLALTALHPWDLNYALDQVSSLPDAPFPRDRMVEATRALATGLGLAEAAEGVRVDFVDIPYGGLCFTIRKPDDVRILANPQDGHVYYSTMFHEFGHALHGRSVRQPYHILRGEPGPFNEGMACTLQRFASEQAWLQSRKALDTTSIAEYPTGWAEAMLARLRALMGQATFEMRAYDHLDGNLLNLWRETMSAFALLPYDEADGWADNPFWTSYPIYLQNYVVAEAIASQTWAAWRASYNQIVDQPALGAWLVERYYAPGASVEWTQKVEQATGRRLSAEALIEDLSNRLVG